MYLILIGVEYGAKKQFLVTVILYYAVLICEDQLLMLLMQHGVPFH